MDATGTFELFSFSDRHLRISFLPDIFPHEIFSIGAFSLQPVMSLAEKPQVGGGAVCDHRRWRDDGGYGTREYAETVHCT